MSTKKLLLALAASLVLALTARPAGADAQSDVDKARAQYEAKNYDDADRRLWALLNPETGTLHEPILRTQARMYWGATMLAKKNPQEASKIFETLLLDDPSYEPDPLSFPSDVIDAFIDTRKRIIDKINAAKAEQARQAVERKAREEEEKRRAAERVRTLERLATEEKVTERHSRWVALIPFGVGQFQNGQKVWGWVFLGTEAACLVGAAIAFPFYVYNRGRALALVGTKPDADPLLSYRERANTAALVNGVLNISAGVIALVGIVHAEVTFAPDPVEIRKRPLPAMGGLSPIVAPAPGGGMLGVEGRF